jgi:formylglycine-generating enzyme required for sulfatase activity
MKRGIQYPVVWVLLSAAAAGLLLNLVVPASGQATLANLPKIDKLEQKNYTETIPDSKIPFDMIAVPGGTFLMGSPEGEKGRAAEEGPQHPVTVKPFWIGKCEVTWEEYDLIWRQKPGNKEQQMHAEKAGLKGKEFDAVTRPTPPYADETFGHGRDGRPCLSVTWHAATEYCYWLSQKTGKLYRLPTEAEWEWACRAGTKTAYHFGDDAKQLGDYAWFEGNAENLVQPVGKKKPNPWGLYDMYGNVAEWCLDQYIKDAYAKRPTDRPTLSPVLIPGEDRFAHVARGGSYADKPTDKVNYFRSAARRGSDKSWIKQDPQRPQSIWWLTDADIVGFRIVRPVEEQDNLKGFRSKVRWESN